ncbi:nuclear transport factor 2 family protein [Niveispirillum sp. KHB5.9]|uniref:nuclear transport factor 2 family protein n=1 Tax=Niveispirillum sp. KHB5.9 TaxID=3400269 RepID=UPI003A877856
MRKPLILASFLSALALPAQAASLPEGPALQAAIEKADTEFFKVFFEGCDPTRVAAMLMPDFEMYHDKGGEVARSAAPFVAEYQKGCEEKKKPDAWRSRRELVAGTMTLHPIAGVGVIEQGDHVFYERKGDGPEKLVGKARFTQLWRLEPDGWKLARVFSYDHEAVK